MRKVVIGLLVVIFSGITFAGCAKKEAVKAEETVVPAIVTAPEAPPPVLEPPAAPPPPPPPPAPVQADIPREAPKVEEARQQPVPVEVAPEIALESIHFDFDKYYLREPDRDILTRNAALIQDKIKGNILIEGHCDERGSLEYNLALGEKRAMSAMKYLITLGVGNDRLSTISYGEEKPLDQEHNEDAWAKNRRAQFVAVAD